MKVNLIVLGFILFPMVFSAEAATISKIELSQFKDRTLLTVFHDGQGKFSYFSSEKMSNVILEAQDLELPSKLTKVIFPVNKGGPIIQVTPYSSHLKGKPLSKIVLQLKESVAITATELPGKFVLELGRKMYNKGFREASAPKGRTWSEVDSILSNSSASDKSEEVAEKLVSVLNSSPDKKEYFGSKVTFEGSSVSVHDIFRLVGEASGLNIVSDNDVTYSSTFSVKDIPWDQLLDIVVQQAQLRAVVSGNVIRIITLDKYTKEQENRLRQTGLDDDLQPVSMAVIPLSYMPAEDIKKMIETLMVKRSDTDATREPAIPIPVTTSAGPGQGGVIRKPVQDFARGKLEIDTRSNSIILTNTREAIERIRRLVKELDIPLPQVLIDSKIVIASETFSRSMGVRWGGRATSSGTGRAGAAGGFLGPSVTLGDAAASGAPAFSVAVSQGELFGFQVGAGRHGNLNAALSLAEANGISKTVASPRVIVNNKKSATISDGQTIVISTLNAQGSSATTLTPRLSLTVTPQVTADNSVLLRDLTITKGAAVRGAESPTTDDKTITTEVLVESGSTLVLGGVYQFETGESDSGIPLLKDLPFLGHLFKRNSSSVSKSELMVFITPQIIEPNVVSGAKESM